jgi:MraZ protein
MLIGQYTHTLDPKKRLSLPAKFRKELGETVVVSKGLDSCIFVFSQKGWEEFAQKFSGLSFGQSGARDFNRFMLSSAVETEVDSAGRILIPDFLKSFAKLSQKVVLAGVNNRVEIWDAKTWDEYASRVEKQADTLAEKLGDVGAL